MAFNARARVCAGCLWVLSSATTAWGQTVHLTQDEGAADLGTGWNILSIPHAAFRGMSYNQMSAVDSDDYLQNVDILLNNRAFQASVQLPSGAAIGHLNLYARDTGPESVVAELIRLTGYGGLPQCTGICFVKAPATETLATVFTLGDAGYQYVSSTLLAPLHTVDNNVTQGGGLYIVQVSLPAASQYAFKGVDLWWKRQIAPAPSIARFTDVPTTAQFFAEVEALAASGITQGCTATAFCPDAPLTRRQMAAFLARALGLYFPF